MKLGIIRCMQTEDYCPGTADFKIIRDRKGTPIGYPCPFAEKMKELIQKEAGDSVKILDYTH